MLDEDDEKDIADLLKMGEECHRIYGNEVVPAMFLERLAGWASKRRCYNIRWPDLPDKSTGSQACHWAEQVVAAIRASEQE